MRQLIIIATVLLLFGTTARAIPARGVPIVVTQADGTKITIVVHGDEYSGWTSTVDGYQIVQKEGVYYYYEQQLSRSGSGLKASDPSARSSAEAWALTRRFKGHMEAFGAAERMSYPLLNQLSVVSKATENKATTTPKRSLVLLVQFSDVKFGVGHEKSKFSNLLNTGATSARQYFIDNSRGLYTPTFDVEGPYTLLQPRAFYGAKDGEDHDRDPQQMVIDACTIAAKQSVSFSQYAENKAGWVDNVYIIYAGENQAEGGGEDTIWPHRWTLQNKADTRFNGVKVWDYACGSELSFNTTTVKPELAGIGTFCHEFGHVLGLPDFYDTDGAINGQSVGLYHFSIMDRGNYNNQGHTPPHYTALERWLLGWGKLQPLQPDQQISLTRVEEQSQGWYIATTDPGEFYVVEARGSHSWDAYLGGTGLLIYHVDRSNAVIGSTSAVARWRANTINAVASHPCVRLIESGGSVISELVHPDNYNQTKELVRKVFYPGSGGWSSFTGRSYGGIDWRGNAIPIELTNITNADGTVSLATRSSQGTDQPLSFQVSQRSVEVTLLPSLYKEHQASSRYLLEVIKDGSKIGTLLELKQGTAKVSVQGLSPDTPYTASLRVSSNPSNVDELASGTFRTTSISAPFPAITGLRNPIAMGSTVHLGTTNLSAPATKVLFAVNGTELENTSYPFASAGQYTVRCTINYASNDTETIERTITVK